MRGAPRLIGRLAPTCPAEREDPPSGSTSSCSRNRTAFQRKCCDGTLRAFPTSPYRRRASTEPGGRQGGGAEEEEEEESEEEAEEVMAIACIHSCLNGPPANPAPQLSGAKLTISPWSPAIKTAKEESWRGRCVSTAACVILGSAVGLAAWEGFAYAGEMREAAAEGGGGGAASRPRVARWSEKRECPPWRSNSLENVVPENLPRPSARRQLDSVHLSRRAPTVSSCFTL